MENKVKKCPGCKRTSCTGCGIFQKLNTNKQIRVQFPEGFAADAGEGLGISFDVGTTTMAGMLWDLKEGRLLDAETGANPQAIFGADVINRVRRLAGSLFGRMISGLREISIPPFPPRYTVCPRSGLPPGRL